MSDSSFVDGFCLQLAPYFDTGQVKQIRDILNVYCIGYKIAPITTELIVSEYRLPQAYYVYIATKEQDGKMSEGSKRQYQMCLEKLLYRFCLPLEQITINHLRMFIQEISVDHTTGKHLSKATINQRKHIIRSFFSWLYEEEYIPKDPSRRIRPERSDSKPRTAFQDVQIENIRTACKTERDRAVVDLLVSSGIRVSECVGLNRSDVDLEKREAVVFGKGKKWRTAYIDASAVVSLKRYLSSRNDDNPALFVSYKKPHNRISTGSIRKCLHELTKESGVDCIIPHRFRHTMATEAINSGMPIESVQALLGHSEIGTTMHYAHVSTDKVKMDHQRYLK